MKWHEDLIYDIRFNDERDDRDWPFELVYFPNQEFSQCNRDMLAFEFNQIADRCHTILEIGVSRNGELSSTKVLLDAKRPDAIYLGIDIEDKSYLDNQELNIHTLKIDSKNVDAIMDKIEALTGKRRIDFLFIDGWHSVNQVLLEWEYTRWLAEDGVVGFHDTNKHPGPSRFIYALDESRWMVSQYCKESDNGIAFTRKRLGATCENPAKPQQQSN